MVFIVGISIATLTGSGLFEKARLAEQESKNAQELEDTTLKDYENKIGKYINSSYREELQVEEIPFTWNSELVKSKEYVNIKRYGHMISGYMQVIVNATENQ